MGKKIGMVIGASQDAIHTIKKARKQGIYVVALDGNPHAEGLGFADEGRVVDISDMQKVCQEVEQIKPDFILPVPIGRYLITTGYMNEKYKLPGVMYSATRYSTDKYLYHDKLNQFGLRNTYEYLVNAQQSIADIEITYPAILKPRFGSGSRDIFYIANYKQLQKAYDIITTKKEDFILERFVEGTEYGVDGAVIDGKLYITLLREKGMTPLPQRQAVSYSVVQRNIQNTPLFHRIEKYLKKAADVLEYDNCHFQVDLIANEKELFAVEMAPRPTGHSVHDVFVPMATKIDLAEEYIKFLMGGNYTFEANSTRNLRICYFYFEPGILKEVPKQQNLKEYANIVMWNCNLKVNDKLEKVINGHSIMGRGFFIIEGSDEQELEKQNKWVLSQFIVDKDK